MQTGKKPLKNLVPGRDLFYVPKYQRNYSWDEKQRRELWEDLLESLDKTHYIGTFLFEHLWPQTVSDEFPEPSTRSSTGCSSNSSRTRSGTKQRLTNGRDES